MQRLLSIALSCLFAVSLSAQEPSITYPYNPDSNTDSLIGASDLVDFLPFYGEEFTPEPLTIEGMSVEEWMEQQTSSSGGGCDFLYPEKDGMTPILHYFSNGDYVVPNNKNFYLIRSANWDDGMVDGQPLGFQGAWSVPCIFHEGQTLGDNNQFGVLSGYLVDSTSDLLPITHNFEFGNYTIPENKYLVLLRALGWQGIINGNSDLNGGVNGDMFLILPPGLSLNDDNSSGSLNGYLVDEDYFADCGGGGGVDISGLQEQIDAVAADSYAADAALLTASDNADDELQDQIDETVSNLQEQLDSALASNAELQAQVEELQNNSSISISQYGDTLSINGYEIVIPNISQSNLNYIFNDYGEVTDSDGNTYKTLVYGEREWMVENLRTQVGDYNTVDDSQGGFQSFADSVGHYYSAADVINNVCPSGWHVSTIQDWQDFHYEIYGTEMNPMGYTNPANNYEDNNYQILWSQYQGGTNQSAFNLFLTGYWSNSGTYITGEPESTHFWCPPSQCSGNGMDMINLQAVNGGTSWSLDVGCTSISNIKAQVRCVKD